MVVVVVSDTPVAVVVVAAAAAAASAAEASAVFLPAPNLGTATLVVDVVGFVVLLVEEVELFDPSVRLDVLPRETLVEDDDKLEDVVDGRVDDLDKLEVEVKLPPGREDEEEELVNERFKALELLLLIKDEAPGEGRFNIVPVEALFPVPVPTLVPAPVFEIVEDLVKVVEEVETEEGLVRDVANVDRLVNVDLIGALTDPLVVLVEVVVLVVVEEDKEEDKVEEEGPGRLDDNPTLVVLVIVRVKGFEVFTLDDVELVEVVDLEAKEDTLEVVVNVVAEVCVGLLFNVDVVPTLDVLLEFLTFDVLVVDLSVDVVDVG